MRLCGSVEVSVNLTVLDELVFGNHLLEFLLRDEVVVDAIFLARPGSSRRIRDTKAETFSEAVLGEVFDQSAFTDTGWTTYNERSVLLAGIEICRGRALLSEQFFKLRLRASSGQEILLLSIRLTEYAFIELA